MYINFHYYRSKLTHKAFNACEVEPVFLYSFVRKNCGTGTASEHKKIFFHCKERQTLAQFPQRCCEVSICGDTHNLTGQDPGKPDLGDPDEQGVWTRCSCELPYNLNDSLILLLSSDFKVRDGTWPTLVRKISWGFFLRVPQCHLLQKQMRMICGLNSGSV